MRDSESESTTIKVAGGCLVAIIWVFALPFLILESDAVSDDHRRRVASSIAVAASVLVVIVARYFARKSDRE
ncbi:MAG: hypothetical protein WAU68_12315 [Vitreimonas sp.]